METEVSGWKVWDINVTNPGIAPLTLTLNFGPQLGIFTNTFDPQFLSLLRQAIVVCLGFVFLAASMRLLSWR